MNEAPTIAPFVGQVELWYITEVPDTHQRIVVKGGYTLFLTDHNTATQMDWPGETVLAREVKPPTGAIRLGAIPAAAFEGRDALTAASCIETAVVYLLSALDPSFRPRSLPVLEPLALVVACHAWAAHRNVWRMGDELARKAQTLAEELLLHRKAGSVTGDDDLNTIASALRVADLPPLTALASHIEMVLAVQPQSGRPSENGDGQPTVRSRLAL